MNPNQPGFANNPNQINPPNPVNPAFNQPSLVPPQPGFANNQPPANPAPNSDKSAKSKSAFGPTFLATILALIFILALAALFVWQFIRATNYASDLKKSQAETSRVQAALDAANKANENGNGTDTQTPAPEGNLEKYTITQESDAGGPIRIFSPISLSTQLTYPKTWKATRTITTRFGKVPEEANAGCAPNVWVETSLNIASPSRSVLLHAEHANSLGQCGGLGDNGIAIVRSVSYLAMPNLANYHFMELIAEVMKCNDGENFADCKTRNGAFTGQYYVYTGIVKITGDPNFADSYKIDDPLEINSLVKASYYDHADGAKPILYIVFTENRNEAWHSWSNTANFDAARKLLSDNEYLTARDMVVKMHD